MTKYKVLIVGFSILFGLTTLLFAAHNPSEEQTSLKSQSPDSKAKELDLNLFPIADFSAPRPTETTKIARGKRHDKSRWRVDPEALSDSTVLVDTIDLTLPALPTTKADAIVSGTIAQARACLSNDRSGIYSTFSFVIDEVFKQPKQSPIKSVVDVEREGGRVKFPSGRIHLYMVSEQRMPKIGGTYVLFLAKTDDESVFEIITGYEVDGYTVTTNDDLPKARPYEGMSTAEFLKDLKNKITNP